MEKPVPRNRVSDARGVGMLAVEATLGVAGLVESLHHNISRAPGPLGAVERAPMRGVAGLVYRSVRGVTRVVGAGLDVALGAIAPLRAQEPSSRRRDALLAVLNGVLGDRLAASGNPLAIEMRLRRGGVALELTPDGLRAAVPRPASRVVVLVHGLCLGDLSWHRKGHDHGAALARESGAAPALTELYLNYNSGRPIADNGRAFAALLEELAQAWPVPLEEIAIVAHSMGGLVTRSACEHGARAGHGWIARLRSVVFLGTPHAGAPLERGGKWIDIVLDQSPYTAAFARLGRIRSAGITDLRHGPQPPMPLPDGVACHAIAASLARRRGALRERLLGDGLVPLASALGTGAGPGGVALFPPARQAVAYGTGHLDLLSSKRVYRRVARYLSETTLQTVGGQG
jgi:hypothetical protein